MMRNRTATACPQCGGDDRFYLISQPRNGGDPFWLCRQCRYVEPVDPTATDTIASPERVLTLEERTQAHRGYTAVAECCEAYLWSEDGKPYREYLRSRGLRDDTIRKLRLGAHPDTWCDGVGPVLWKRNDGTYEGAALGGLLGPQGKPKNLLRGVITIPYFDGDTCVLIRTRKLHPGDGSRYFSPAGVELFASATPRLYLHNDLADANALLLTEGEFKAAVAHQSYQDGEISIPPAGRPSLGFLPDAYLDALAGKTVYLAYDSEERKEPFQLSPGERYTLLHVEKMTGVHLEQQLASLKAQLETENKKRNRDDDTIDRVKADIGQLEAELAKTKARNIRVKVIRFPRPADVGKVDLDSFILEHGADALQVLIDTAQPADLWYEQHNGGGYRYERGGIWQGNKPLANYQARIVENIVKDDDIEQVAFLRIELQAPNGTRRTVDISARDWADERKAIQAIRANLHDNTWIDEGAPTLTAIKALSRHGDDPVRRVVYTCTGWHNVNGKWHFLMPDGAIAGAGIVVSLSSEIAANAPGNHYALCGEGIAAEGVKALRSLFAGDVCGQVVALPLFAHIVQSAIHRFIEDGNRSLLWPYGESGVLKTATVRALLSSFGPRFTAERLDGAPVPKWDSTANGLEQVAFTYQDLPVLIDDYKQGGTRDQTLKLFLHRYSEASGRTRSTRERTIDRTFPARCLAIGTGEDRPSGDFGAAGRLITFQFSTTTVNQDELAKLQHAGACGHLAACIREFIRAVALHLDHQGPAGLRKHLYNLIEADDTTQPVHRRTVSTMRHNRMAWLLFTKWLHLAGYCSDDERKALDHAHKSAVDTLVRQQAGEQQAAKPSVMFLNILREALATGEVILDGATSVLDEYEEKTDHKRPERLIGFLYKNCIAIHPEKAFALVQQRLKSQGGALQFSSAAVYQQLDNDGLIAAKDEKHGKTTKNVKYGGKSHRVLILKAEAFDLPDPPDDEATPEVTPVTHEVEQGVTDLIVDKTASELELIREVTPVTQVTPKTVETNSIAFANTAKEHVSSTDRCNRVTESGLPHSNAANQGYTQGVTEQAKGVTTDSHCSNGWHEKLTWSYLDTQFRRLSIDPDGATNGIKLHCGIHQAPFDEVMQELKERNAQEAA